MINLFFRENAKNHIKQHAKMYNPRRINDEIIQASVGSKILTILNNENVVLGKKVRWEDYKKLCKYTIGPHPEPVKKCDFAIIDNSLSYPGRLILYDKKGHVDGLPWNVPASYIPLVDGPETVIERMFRTYHTDDVKKNRVQKGRFAMFTKII